MNQSVKYRQNAAECCEAARILSDHSQKAKLLVMADTWKLLADHAKRNSHFEVASTRLTNHGNGLDGRVDRGQSQNPTTPSAGDPASEL